MPTLSTGLIIAGAYADKLRKTLFAQLSEKVKSGEISPQMVAKAAGDVNSFLFDILVNDLKLDKGDVVRVRIDYKVKGGEVSFDFDTLRLEVFKRVPDDEVSEVVKRKLKK